MYNIAVEFSFIWTLIAKTRAASGFVNEVVLNLKPKFHENKSSLKIKN